MTPVPVVLIVEDPASEVVARKILETSGKDYAVVNTIRWTKDAIRHKIRRINRSARGFPYFVLTDQDTAERCPPIAIQELGEPLHPNLMYRFATMEVESWILADRYAAAKFLRVPVDRIPLDTDALDHPKEFLVGLAKKSRSKAIRMDMTPAPGSTSRVGPDYNGRLRDFVAERWNVRAACAHSASLRRSVQRIETFAPVAP